MLTISGGWPTPRPLEVEEVGSAISWSGLEKRAEREAACADTGVSGPRFLTGYFLRGSALVGILSGICSDIFCKFLSIQIAQIVVVGDGTVRILEFDGGKMKFVSLVEFCRCNFAPVISENKALVAVLVLVLVWGSVETIWFPTPLHQFQYKTVPVEYTSS